MRDITHISRLTPAYVVIHGKHIRDILKRSVDAEFILEAEEFDFQWYDIKVNATDIVIEDEPYLTRGDPDGEKERLSNIKDWINESGGIVSALKESPPLFLFHDKRAELLDGWHRLMLAKKIVIKIPIIIGIPT